MKRIWVLGLLLVFAIFSGCQTQPGAGLLSSVTSEGAGGQAGAGLGSSSPSEKAEPTREPDVIFVPTPGDVVDIRAGFSSDSFPAGHVMSGAFFYGFLFYVSLDLRLRAARIALLASSAAVLALVGWVNVYVGVHWPSDVVGGYAWGFTLLLPLLGLDAMVREVEDLLLYTLGLRRL